MEVTRMDALRAAAADQVVELPGFGDGKPFCARLRRLSLLSLAQAGKIPNELMSAVSELYRRGEISAPDLQVTGETMLFIAEQALLEPTLPQLREAGVELTDLQLTAIYLYSREGVSALRPFRAIPGVLHAVQNGPDVARAAQRAAGG